jgi:Barrel-sandwich domain of CusB or HlyD membrane-fusion/GAF domain
VLLAGRAGQQPRWTKLGDWHAGATRPRTNFNDFLEQAADRAAREGSFVEEDDGEAGEFTLGVKLRLARAEDEAVMVLRVLDFTDEAAADVLVRLSLAADVPASYQAGMASRQAQADVERFATVLDLLAPVNAERRFLAGALALVNGIASRLQCDRVSLGWIQGGYARLRAISRMENFNRQMNAAQLLEAAMDECADQDDEVAWPAHDGTSTVGRDHEKFATEQNAGNLCSVPMRAEGKTVAVITCERQSAPFSQNELRQLRLLCDHAIPRLSDLRRSDRWFGARIASGLRERAARLLGPEHTWMKVFAILGVVLLAALFLVRVSYRVEGNFIVRSEAVAYITAPFEGYVEKVSVRPGDAVAAGSEIVALNRAELFVEKANAMAEIERYESEAAKARSAKSLAEMVIASALARQAATKRDLIDYRLSTAVLKAPFDGVVVEGDLRERIGSPVKTGEAMYKVARLDGLYVEAEVDERDVREILKSSRAEFSFVTQPKQTFKATVVAVEPAAMSKKDVNMFLVRLKPDAAPEAWWRPGMTGLCKISVEKRSLWWILTHRTTDFLRMQLWW